MRHQVLLKDHESEICDHVANESTCEITVDLAYRRLGIVNIAFHGAQAAGDLNWVLIDAGVPGTAGIIRRAAEARFGSDARPSAIILTHGHFDHVGALRRLAERWDVPIYAHELELPYLNGTKAYPPPDPAVGGGLMAKFSSLYPRGPIDVSRWLKPLPADGDVPGMLGWEWLHTPGHTPGHVALWRELDRTLIAGDAFITTNQESAYAVATQAAEIHGPPMYYTPNWEDAEASVRKLSALEPELVVTGHGPALRGEKMRDALDTLARHFGRLAVPKEGRYVGHPTYAEDGS